ncbi:hypothetical protein [Microvirga brassicacearum]|uniref:Uncharacterized protein n=1 Tax=Microvirga brassicacearum TaxID=2580413 RepID=A0A5N3PC97_9HYPH|nr:hypothetical protein [Microvirga brassicacearum]KAB0267386.1 hypothetical protein FEZ63_08725 [Microvirga brassicacearum]
MNIDMSLHDDITDLETEIDRLAEAAERCRKIMVVARGAMATGSVVLAALVLGLLRSDALILLTSVTAILAGIAVFGSHRSTLQELKAKIAAQEARRSGLIDAMDLHVVKEA